MPPQIRDSSAVRRPPLDVGIAAAGLVAMAGVLALTVLARRLAVVADLNAALASRHALDAAVASGRHLVAVPDAA